MCNAFSCIISKSGKVIWKMGIDSHDELIKIGGFTDDTLDPEKIQFCRIEISPENKNYLYPDKWNLKIDMDVIPAWWSEDHERKCFVAFYKWKKQLDQILVVKPIVNPFLLPLVERVDPVFLDLLIKWDSAGCSVRDSAGCSVRDSVRDSVGGSVGDSVGGSVWYSVRDSAGCSVRDSVRDSVGGSVGDSVWCSVWDSVWIYIGSFFILEKSGWKYCEEITTEGYPFQPLVDLWEMGIVPSYDGKLWRLHSGKKAQIIWVGTIEDANNGVGL